MKNKVTLSNKIALAFIQLYQKTFSPDKGLLSPWLKWKVCSHKPHCSEYAKQCYQKYWFWQASDFAFERIISCTPSSMIKKDPSSYKVVFFSWATIWKSFLEALFVDSRFDVVWVVTMPDAARDRGMKVKENIIKTLAKQHIWESNIGTPHSLRTSSKKYGIQAKETKQWLESLDADYFVVVAYGKLLPKDILDIPHIWPINVHGSLLPEYRGASPLQSVFVDGKSQSGITVMHMNEWMDTGDMISKLKTSLPLDWTVNNLIARIWSHWPKHLLDSLWDFAKWNLKRVPQEEELSSHCTKIEKSDWTVDIFNDSLQSIYQKYQWYALWPKISFLYSAWNSTKRALIQEITLFEDKYDQWKEKPILWLFWNPVHELKNLNPSIKTLSIKPEGKKAITWSEFQTNYLTK